MAVTLREVAARAGVSRSAVSRTFTDGASVSDRTRKRVMDAAAALGYQPNILASSLTTRRTKLIGLVSDNFRNPIFLEVFDHFTRAIQAAGYRPLLVNWNERDMKSDPVAMLTGYSVDGVLIASSTISNELVAGFAKSCLPTVHTFGRHSETPIVDTLTVDNERCGELVAEAMIDRGLSCIAFMGGPASATSTQDREVGFVAGAGDVPVSVSYAQAYSFDAGRAEMQRLIATGEPLAQAYFCGDDVLSMGAMSALADAGISVPEDVGIVGFNDMTMAGWQCFDLTTVHQPLEEIVQSSVARLLELLRKPNDPPKSRLFQGQLTERGTLRSR